MLGAVPVIYPFIVNDPGEAAQAKRRIAAVTIGHLTPPLIEAGLHGEARELEALFDEYAQAQELDPRRARMLADAILVRARESGLAAESGLSHFDDVAGRRWRGSTPGFAISRRCASATGCMCLEKSMLRHMREHSHRTAP